MSQYVVIKKGGVILLEYCRSSRVYEAINRTSSVPFDEFGGFTLNKLDDAVSYLKEEASKYEKAISTEREKLPFCKKKADVDSCFECINACQEELDGVQRAITTLSCLKGFLAETDEEGKPYTLEWGIL